jgi:hypothetical protein
MNRYENGKVYKLINLVDDQIYVGSTCLTLSKRMYGHRAAMKAHPNRTQYQHFANNPNNMLLLY